MKIPVAISEVSAEWLTAALDTRYPGTVVNSVTHGPVLHGTGTKVRLMLDYNPAGHAAGLPPTMWAKGGFDGVHGEIIGGGNAAEALFFSQVAPTLDVNIPGCYYAETEGPDGASILLLEDLLNRNASFGRATEPLTVDAVRTLLELQADYHAEWWEKDGAALDGLGMGQPWLKAAITHLLGPDNWNEQVTKRAEIIPEILRDRDRVVAASLKWFEWETKGPHTLLHGDCHVGNLFFERDGKPGLLDWQVVSRGPFTHDITYLLVSALTVEDRRANEEALIRHYLGRLDAAGVAQVPTYDEAMFAHRCDIMHGFWWAVTPSTMQPEDICCATTERFAAAAADLGTLEALESA